MSILLKTIVGSRLHGFAGARSDIDMLEVHTEPFYNAKTKTFKPELQTMTPNAYASLDVTSMTLSHFVERAYEGSHQALDAMFSTKARVDKITELREAFVSGPNIITAFASAITSTEPMEDIKKRRHAVRFTLNLIDILETGRYNPTLSAEKKEYILSVISLERSEFLKEMRTLSPISLGVFRD